MSRILILLGLFAAVSGTALQVLANGSLPDGSSGTAAGTGLGANVAGTATVLLNDTVSASGVTLTATGPAVSPSPIPRPVPKPVEVVPVVKPKVYVAPKPVCEDIKDDCDYIKNYKKCGYCVTEKYYGKGYGCGYTEEVILKKKGASSKEYEYETVITPKCNCKGSYILKASACPSCASVLAELLECAKVSGSSEVVEIPASCLKTVGVTVEYLTKCEYIKKPEATVVVKDPKEVVVVKPEVSKKDPKEVVVVKPVVSEKYPKEVVIVDPKPAKKPATATASASASATATGKGASASASASATATVKP
eukprot:TRINITY_DN731_c0_g2_i2.p3 TRINITY_DN731_c0_g2~~TRINITY_DN731_c0_g2_i2.p3  ORF type:complete len:308 (-),score=55.05 TRINITY_DN731_c0_g2_i2:315-1238(-)